MPVPKTGHRDATAEVEDVSPIGRVQVRTLRDGDLPAASALLVRNWVKALTYLGRT